MSFTSNSITVFAIVICKRLVRELAKRIKWITDGMTLEVWDRVLLNYEISTVTSAITRRRKKPERDILRLRPWHARTQNSGFWRRGTYQLSIRVQCVVVDGCVSAELLVMSGVLQGFVLGPILFLVLLICWLLPSVLQCDERVRFRISLQDLTTQNSNSQQS